MKHSLTTILLATACAPAYAGGLADPIVTPPVTSSTPAQTDWSGPYIGIFGGQRTVTTTTEISGQTITPTYAERPVYGACKDDGGHGPNTGDKCRGDRDHIDLTFGPDLGSHDKYTQTGFMSGNRVFLYQEPVTIVDSDGNIIGQGIADGTNPSGTLYRLDTGQTETVRGPDLIETFTETLTDTSEDTTYGVFAGYRHAVGPVIAGLETGFSADMQTIDAQVGLPMGNLLAYGFAGGAQSDYGSGTTYGAGLDLLLNSGLLIGAAYRETDFGVQDVTVRVGWGF